MSESAAVHMGVALLVLATWGVCITVRVHRAYIRTQLRSLRWITLTFTSVVAGSFVSGVGFLVYRPASFTLSLVLAGLALTLALVAGACVTVAVLVAYFWEYNDSMRLVKMRVGLSTRQRLAGTIPPGFQASGTQSAIGRKAGVFCGLLLLGGTGAITWWGTIPSLDVTTNLALVFPLSGVVLGLGFIVLSLTRSK